MNNSEFRHIINWETRECRFCKQGLYVVAGIDGPCPGRKHSSFYFTPFVQNITVKQPRPNICLTHYYDWNDRCTQCGVHEDDA